MLQPTQTGLSSYQPYSMQNKEYKYKPGRSYPSGAKPDAKGVNFSIFTRHADSIELLLFETLLFI